jgi:ribonucleoside-triphosphate reductase
MSRNSKLISENLREEIAKELGVYDQVKNDGGSWANVSSKNVATLEGEDRKRENREIQRYRMKKQLKKMFPELASQYSKDLENHIIYTHDEASTSVLKPYCMAVSLFPLMTEGVGNIDMVTPTPPNDIQSYNGQVTNLTFLLSSQCKGAVALGE